MIENRQTHMEWIMHQWDNLAALAYAGYQEGGPGVVFIDTIQLGRTWKEGQSMAAYIKAKDVRLIGPRVSDVKRMVRAYDPETQVVVALRHHTNDGSFSCYRIAMPNAMSPREAYETLGDDLGLNEETNGGMDAD